MSSLSRSTDSFLRRFEHRTLFDINKRLRKRCNKVAAVILAQPRAHLKDVLSMRIEKPLPYVCREVLRNFFRVDTPIPIAILDMILCNAAHGLVANPGGHNLPSPGLPHADDRDLCVVEIRD